MKYIEIIANASSEETIRTLAESAKAETLHFGMANENGMQSAKMLVKDSKVQKVIDKLQVLLGAQPTSRIIVLPVEATIPRIEENKNRKGRAFTPTTIREALYDDIEKGARLELNYLILVVLSTVVASIGLIEANVAVVIGAMVIAPLLGPNLALSLGTTLGDAELVKKAIVTLLVGTSIAIAFSFVVGLLWSAPSYNAELLGRTSPGLDDVALALASGAAAALSLTSGLSSVLVGVMVAVALLPPAVTIGIMLGQGSHSLAFGAVLLLAVNIVCVNIACKTVFFTRGISPRTITEKRKAKRSYRMYVLTWILLLLAVLGLMLVRSQWIITIP